MKKSGLKNSVANYVVEKQEHSKNVIWKIDTSAFSGKVQLYIKKDCEVLYCGERGRRTIFDEDKSYTINTQEDIVKARGELYGVDTTPFELVCGTYDVTYTDYGYGKPAKVGIYAKFKVHINNASVLYDKLINNLQEDIPVDKIKETLGENLKNELFIWLSKTIQNVGFNDVNLKCIQNIDSLDKAFDGALKEWGLILHRDSLSIGQVKFDKEYLNGRKDKETEEEQRQREEENRRLENKKKREELDLISTLQSKAKDADNGNEVKAVCPKCKKVFDRGYNSCPYCEVKLKK